MSILKECPCKIFFFCTVFWFLCCPLFSFVFDSYKEFMDALAKDDLYKIKQLLDDHLDVNAGKDGNSIIVAAVKYGNVELVKLLAMRGADLDAVDRNRETPLMIACQEKQREMAGVLLDLGANPNVDLYGIPLLLWAYRQEDLEFAEKLMDKGADPDRCDMKDHSIVFRLLENGPSSSLKHLMKFSPKLVEGNFKHARSLVNYLVNCIGCARNKDQKSQYVQLLQDFIDAGADLNVRSEDGKTPLLEAMEIGETDLVKTLISKGADLEIPDNDGKTILFHVVEKNNRELIKACIEGGADPDTKSYTGVPLIIKAAHACDIALMKLLREKSVNLNAVNDLDGLSALHIALLYREVPLAKWLIRNGADVNKCDKNRLYPLDYAIQLNLGTVINLLNRLMAKRSNRSIRVYPYPQKTRNGPEYTLEGEKDVIEACRKGDLAGLKKLLEKGAVIEGIDKSGRTALHIAVTSGNPDMVRFLLEQGIDVDVRNGSGDTPLLEAVKACQTGVCSVLIDSGADVNFAGINGLRPIQYAVIKKSLPLVKLLIERKADLTVRDINQRCLTELPTSDDIKALLSSP